MDEKSKSIISQKNFLSAIWTYVIMRPDNPKITLFDRLVTSISRITMFLILIGVFITFYEVLLRYIFGSPTLWVNELTLWLGSIIYLMAGIYTMQRRGHIRITVIYDMASENLKLFFEYLSIFVLVVYAVLMLVGGYDVAWEALISWERFGTVFDPPIPATIKPLVIIVTLVVAFGALNNMLVDWYNYGKESTNLDQDNSTQFESSKE